MRVGYIREYNAKNESIFIDLINDTEGNTTPSDIYIQVCADANVQPKGRIIDSIGNVDLAVVNLSDMRATTAISKAGIYAIDASGLSSLTIQVSGETKLVVKGMTE